MKNPFYSIIIPVYKAEKYLADCLDSILRQTYKDFEVILVDDGSPDASSDICDNYAACDSRIAVIHKEQNEGVVRARNTALMSAKGDYILFVDSDDWVDSDMLEVYREIIGDGSIDFVISRSNYLEAADKTFLQEYSVRTGSYEGIKVNELLDRMFYTGTFFEYYINPAFWGKAFKKELVLPIMFSIDPEICVGEDLCCIYACLLNAKSIYVCENKGMYHYRCTDDSSSKNYKGGFFENTVKVFSCLENLIRNKEGEDALIKLDYPILFAVYSGAAYYFSPGSRMTYKEKVSAVRKMLSYDRFRKALNRTRIDSGITYVRKKILAAIRREKMFTLFFYLYLEKILIKTGLYRPKNGV